MLDIQDLSSSAQRFISKRDALGGFFQRTFDPAGAEMTFNAQEAERARSFNALEAERARSFNAQEAQLNRDFQLYTANTAFQRQRSDMLAAGLNPYSMYKSGGSDGLSGSAASGSAASGSAASGAGGGTALTKVMSAILDVGLAAATKGASLLFNKAESKRRIGFGK